MKIDFHSWMMKIIELNKNPLIVVNRKKNYRPELKNRFFRRILYHCVYISVRYIFRGIIIPFSLCCFKDAAVKLISRDISAKILINFQNIKATTAITNYNSVINLRF